MANNVEFKINTTLTMQDVKCRKFGVSRNFTWKIVCSQTQLCHMRCI